MLRMPQDSISGVEKENEGIEMSVKEYLSHFIKQEFHQSNHRFSLDASSSFDSIEGSEWNADFLGCLFERHLFVVPPSA